MQLIEQVRERERDARAKISIHIAETRSSKLITFGSIDDDDWLKEKL